MLQSASYLPSQITELASVIGTLELKSGKVKAARKLFQKALDDPNDNVVAQAYWASRRLKAFDLDERYLKVPLSFEARYISFSQANEWEKAVRETWRWLFDQPFSARPAIQGSYLAGVALENYIESEEIAKCGLIANPNDPILLNNLAFALANQDNKIGEAEEVFSRIETAGLELHKKIVWNATKGLIMYRKGFKGEGREYYLKAIKMATDVGYNELRARAAIYLAREEKLSNSPLAKNAIQDAIEYSKGLLNPEIEILLKRIVQ
jgi:tetratricopeptide (TPR) repeat protein